MLAGAAGGLLVRVFGEGRSRILAAALGALGAGLAAGIAGFEPGWIALAAGLGALVGAVRPAGERGAALGRLGPSGWSGGSSVVASERW